MKALTRFHTVLLAFTGFFAGMLLTALAAVIYISTARPPSGAMTFEECVARGYPVLETFPRQCRLPDGRLVVEPITLEPPSSAASSDVPDASAPRDNRVLVFFSNVREDPQMLDCSRVSPVERVIGDRSDPARAALEELLKGPAPEEQGRGFITSLPEGVAINGISVTDGVARAAFSDALERGVGGSCRVTNIRAQITQTLKQFPNVRDVVISVDGRVEDVLQP